MEHRYSQRTPARLKLLIYKKSLPVALARLQNISRTGLFALTDCCDFAPTQILDIEFLLNTAPAHPRFRGMVVHRHGHGIGLEIDDADQRGYANLWRGVRAEHALQAAALAPWLDAPAPRGYWL